MARDRFLRVSLHAQQGRAVCLPRLQVQQNVRFVYNFSARKVISHTSPLPLLPFEQDKMDLAMGIAVGSACQASMFVFPSTILIAWAMDKDLTLMFPKYDLFIYLMSVIIVAHLIAKGTSNWLEGSTLVTSYVVIGMGYWFLPPAHVRFCQIKSDLCGPPISLEGEHG